MVFSELFSLQNKTALITGGDTGIGLSMATALAEAGADIIVASRNIPLKGSKIEGIAQKLNKKCTTYNVDLNDRESIYQFVAEVKKNHSVDILVNNAGMILRNPAAEHSDELWDKVLNVNLDAQFILAREFGKEMINKGAGKIIFTASLLSFQGGINVPGYAASKGAISSLVKALSNEWANKGINVNAIAPGYIATDNTSALRADENRNKSILDRIPAGRWGEGDDFKGPIIFLASEAANYVNGTILTVDGGWMGR